MPLWDRRVALGIKIPNIRSMSESENILRGWYERGYVPHFDAKNTFQHVTFHLADSLPSEAINKMERQIEHLDSEKQITERRIRIQELLDNGIGSCLLNNPTCAHIVEQSLKHGSPERYQLLTWCIMPNHVHILIQQRENWPIAKLVQSWKRHTTKNIKKVIRSDQKIWQRDYWDRFIRDEDHFITAHNYILNNPVTAGLVKAPSNWAFSGTCFNE